MKKLELYYPVKPWVITQRFGDNSACINASGRIVAKLPGSDTCPTGYNDFYKSIGMIGHNGQDVAAFHGQEVRAAHDGVVDEVSTELERGLGVGICTNEMFEFEGGEYFARTRYWHLKGLNVRSGQKVRAGDLIGWADNTGKSSGDHLHFELIPYLIGNVFQNNGYYGKIDPAPYFNKIYARDMNVINLTRDIAQAIKEFFIRNPLWRKSGDPVK